MLRKIVVGGKELTFEVVWTADNGDVGFRRNGEAGGASAIEVMPRVWSVLLGGRSFEARVISDDGEVVVEIGGERYPVAVEDPRRQRARAGGGHGEARAAVLAPMPGKIVRVLVTEGEAVTLGRGVVVIEAMKMQNELKSPREGRVVSVPVKEGETVAAGAVLAVVE